MTRRLFSLGSSPVEGVHRPVPAVSLFSEGLPHGSEAGTGDGDIGGEVQPELI